MSSASINHPRYGDGYVQHSYRVDFQSLDAWFVRTRVSVLIALLLMPSIAAAAITPEQVKRGNLYQFDTGLRLGDASVFPAWENTRRRNDQQWLDFNACLADAERCSRRLRALRALVLKAGELGTKDKLELVNRYLNRRKYKPDRRRNNPALVQQEGHPPTGGVDLNARSHWSTLFEFMERGGDCEDFAAAKYFLLRQLGLEAERLRIVVVWERRERGFHAILAYHWPNNDVWLLESDNGIKKRSHHGYRYVYALNEQAVWDYRERPEWNALQ